MKFPPHLLDELARVFAHVALDRLLKDAAAAVGQDRGKSAKGESAKIERPVDAASTEKTSSPCEGVSTVANLIPHKEDQGMPLRPVNVETNGGET